MCLPHFYQCCNVKDELSLESHKFVMFLLGISENKATRKEFAIYQSNVVVPNEPVSTMLKTRDVISAKQKVFGGKKPGPFGTTKLLR